MAKLEDEMIKFSKPIFISNNHIELTKTQHRVLSVWISLITILYEYRKPRDAHPAISERDCHYIKNTLFPPDNWSIFYASLDYSKWECKFKQYTLGIEPSINTSPILYESENTQISSFGIGGVFFQVFTCPIDKIVADYRVAARVAHLSQLWPIESGFWPFSDRYARFPTGFILDDELADVVADAFYKRLQIFIRMFNQHGNYNF